MIPTAVVTFAGADVTCLVERAAIRHGRDDPSTQPNASSLTADIRGAIPAGVDIGSTVTLTAWHAGTAYPRFVGRVTDLALGWDTSPDDPVAQMMAVGAVASMGRRVVGDAPWPQEPDGVRINRIIGLSGVPTDALRSDPGTVDLLPRDVDAQPALELAQSAATDGGGLLWQSKDGAVLYADAEHRRGAQSVLTIDPCTVPLAVAWTRTTQGLVNDLRIRYGVAPEGGQQPELHVSDPASIAARGTYGASLTTALADPQDAADRANVILVRQSDPAWVLTGLSMLLDLLTKTLPPALDISTTAAVLALEVNDLVTVTGLPDGSPYVTALLWVEGWNETITLDAWRIDYAISDYCRTAPAPRWNDVLASTLWNTADPGMTWNDATCMPPLPSQGRWDDTPASTRWDTVPVGTTWNTWTG